MAKVLLISGISLIVFSLGQWAHSEGYTLAKGWRWAKAQIPTEQRKQLEAWTAQPKLGSLWKKTESLVPRPIPRQIPGTSKAAPARTTGGAPAGPSAGKTDAKKTNATEIDEEGLSPTDREALIGLLK